MSGRTAIDAPYKLELVVLEDVDMNGLKGFWDISKGNVQDGAYAVVCASASKNGQVSLLAAGNDAAADAGFDAGRIIKAIAPLVDGRGGGKAKMAQAGGKDASGIAKIAEAVAQAVSR